MIPQPDGLEFQEWGARVVEEFALDGVLAALPWEEFGAQLLSYGTIPDIPHTKGFDDWRDWARRCMNVLS